MTAEITFAIGKPSQTFQFHHIASGNAWRFLAGEFPPNAIPLPPPDQREQYWPNFLEQLGEAMLWGRCATDGMKKHWLNTFEDYTGPGFKLFNSAQTNPHQLRGPDPSIHAVAFAAQGVPQWTRATNVCRYTHCGWFGAIRRVRCLLAHTPAHRPAMHGKYLLRHQMWK
jgi:hypothetical protein